MLPKSLFVEGISGAAGSMIVTFLFYPLESLKTRVQLVEGESEMVLDHCRRIYMEEGLTKGFYMGCQYQIVAVGCSNMIYFATYTWLKQKIKDPSVYTTLGLGMIAGWANVALTSPLWTFAMIKRHEADLKGITVWEKIKEKYEMKGIFALYEPFSFVLVLVPAIHYLLYGRLKILLVQIRGKKQLNSASYFIIGLFAKLLTTLLTYPLQLAQNVGRFKSLKALKDNVNEDGLSVLFKGLKVKLLQTGVMTGFHMMFYEKLRSYLYLVFFFAVLQNRKLK